MKLLIKQRAITIMCVRRISLHKRCLTFVCVKEFQEYADSVHNDSQLLAEKSRELFILQDVKIADAVDTEVVRLHKVKDEIIDQVDVLLSQVAFPYSNNSEFEQEITHYLKSRGKLEIVITKPQ